jgi:hypothetical protein
MAAGGNARSKLVPDLTACCSEKLSHSNISKMEAPNAGSAESTLRSSIKNRKPPKYTAKSNSPRRPSTKRTRKHAAAFATTPVQAKVGGNESSFEQSLVEFCSPTSEEHVEFSLPKPEPKSTSGPFLETDFLVATKNGLRTNQRGNSSNASEFQPPFGELGFALPPASSVPQERGEDLMIPEFELNSCQKTTLSDPFAEYSILEIIDPSNRSA